MPLLVRRLPAGADHRQLLVVRPQHRGAGVRSQPRDGPRPGRDDHRHAPLEASGRTSEDKKSGDNFVELVEDLDKGLASREYRWEFIRPVDEGPNVPQDEFEWDVAQAVHRRSSPPMASRRRDGRPAATGEFRERREVVDNKPEYQYYTPIRITSTSVRLVPREPEPGRGRRRRRRRSATWSRSSRSACPTARRRRRSTGTTPSCWPRPSSPCFWRCSASYVIVRYVIVKPLAHLRDVSDAISHGNIDAAGRHPHRRRVRGAGHGLQPHVAALGHQPGRAARTSTATSNVKVDELAQANMRLYEMNRLKSDFLATMSHELRTPLNASSASATCSSRSPRSTTSRSATCRTSRRRARCCWR